MSNYASMGDYAALTLWKTEFTLLQQVGIEFQFATIKPSYPGSWRDDVRSLADKLGYSETAIIAANPWLLTGNFPQTHHDYILLLIPNIAGKAETGGSSHGSTGITGGGGSENDYEPPQPDDTDAPTKPSEGTWYWPMGSGKWYISQGFKSSHTALDITTGVPGGIEGKPVYATKGGTVVQAYLSDSWGYNILVRHDDTKDKDTGYCYFSRYAHLQSAALYTVGQQVSQGATVGYAGNTGHSTGSHLHFQIYYTKASRTDYVNFNGNASFGANPNGIATFPKAGTIYTGTFINI